MRDLYAVKGPHIPCSNCSTNTLTFNAQPLILILEEGFWRGCLLFNSNTKLMKKWPRQARGPFAWFRREPQPSLSCEHASVRASRGYKLIWPRSVFNFVWVILCSSSRLPHSLAHPASLPPPPFPAWHTLPLLDPVFLFTSTL